MPRRSQGQVIAIALAGVGVLLGWLLVSGAAAPLVEDVVGGSDPATSPPDAAPAPKGVTVNGRRVALSDSTVRGPSTWDGGDPWMSNDHRPEWSSQREVPQGPSGADAAQRPAEPQTPAVQVPENPHGRMLFNSAAPMRRYELKPLGACPQSHGKGLYVGHLTAVPGSGSATISWWDLGDPSTSEYRITSVPVGGQGAVITKTVPAPKTCRDVSMTFDGLTSGTSYVFMLTAANVSPEQGGRIYRADRGQTQTIVIK